MKNDKKGLLFMRENKRPSVFVTILYILAAIIVLMLFVYFLIKISFQTGAVSSRETNMLSEFMAKRILDNPSMEQIAVVNRLLRYGAHLFLFFVLGYLLTYVSLILLRGVLRVFGFCAVAAGCYFLSYYTEYYKQFIEGRHFEMADVRLNYIGCFLGIVFMLFSYLTGRFIYRLEK